MQQPKLVPVLKWMPSHVEACVGVGLEGQSANSNSVLPRESLAMGLDMVSNGLTDRSVVGRRRNKTNIGDEKNGNQDWLAAAIANYSVADVVVATGMSETAVQNVRRRKAKLSFDNLTSMCKAHPEFAALYAAHVGLILPGEAEYIGAVNKTIGAYHRLQAQRGGAE